MEISASLFCLFTENYMVCIHSFTFQSLLPEEFWNSQNQRNFISAEEKFKIILISSILYTEKSFAFKDGDLSVHSACVAFICSFSTQKKVSKLGFFPPLKISQHVATLINQHCQHKISFPAHTKVKQRLTTKKEKIVIIEEKTQ